MRIQNCSCLLGAFLLLASLAAACDKESLQPVVFEPQLAPWPAWAWSHWVWEDDENNQQATLDLVNGYLEHGIPVAAVIVDSPWDTCYSTYAFDPTNYPAPKDMIDRLHADGVRVMLWTVSAINLDCELYQDAADKGYFLLDGPGGAPQITPWWKGDGSLIDYLNPAALAWWHRLIDRALDLGIDGWKTDGTDAFVGMNDYYSGAASRPVGRTEYANLYYRDFFHYTRERLGDDRIITARPIDNYGTKLSGDLFVFAPREISWAPWVGDQDGNFKGIELALNNMYHSAASGYVGSGSDIGGFGKDSGQPLGRSKEVFVRWAQLGSFSPVFENGGAGEHRPWKFDDETVAIYRALVLMRERLLDYMLESGGKAFAKGESVLAFQDDTRYQFLFGPDLFIAPILREGGGLTVSFPAGSDWLWLHDRKVRYRGGSEVPLEFSLETYPAYVRAGSRLSRYLWP